MNKKDYKLEIEKELKKFKLDNYDELLYQAFDGVNQVDEDDLLNALGKANEYIHELFEINEIEIETLKKESKVKHKFNKKDKEPKVKTAKLKNKKLSFIEEKITLSNILILLLIVAIISFMCININLWSSSFIIIAPFMLLIYSFITKGTVVEKALIIVVIILISKLQYDPNYSYFIRQIFNTFFVALAILVVVNLIIAKPLEDNKKVHYKSVINKVNVVDEVMDINVAVGQSKVVIKEVVDVINIKANFNNLIIDATNIKINTKINIDANCSNITILLPHDANIVDKCEINFGSHKCSHKNNEGIDILLGGTLNLSSLKY